MRYVFAELHRDTVEAITNATQHVITGYNFLKWMDGIQVGSKVHPLKVVINCEFSKRHDLFGKEVTITKSAFMHEGVPLTALDAIHVVLGDVGFRFGVRFKIDNNRIYVN